MRRDKIARDPVFVGIYCFLKQNRNGALIYVWLVAVLKEIATWMKVYGYILITKGQNGRNVYK